MTSCEPFRHDLGAYVLGGLDDDETRALETHLATCAACTAEHADIVGLPDLLDLTSEPAPRVPNRLRDRVIADAARRHGRRRWATMAAAAALVAALAGVAVGTQLAPDAETVIAIPLESVEPFDGASGWATLRVDGPELVLALDVEGLAPLPQPSIYEAWLYTYDERIVSIGQLSIDDGAVTVELSARGSLDDYRGFWITAEPDRRDPAHEGPTVLRASLPSNL